MNPQPHPLPRTCKGGGEIWLELELIGVQSNHLVNEFSHLSLVVPKPLLVVFGPQLIYKWALSQSYQLNSKLHLIRPNWTFLLLSPLFPSLSFWSGSSFSQSLSPSIFFQPPYVDPLLLFIVSHLWGYHHYQFPTSHVFPRPLESQGILTNSEDSLGTCPRCQIVFGSGLPKGTDNAWLPTLIWLSPRQLSLSLLASIGPNLDQTVS